MWKNLLTSRVTVKFSRGAVLYGFRYIAQSGRGHTKLLNHISVPFIDYSRPNDSLWLQIARSTYPSTRLISLRKDADFLETATSESFTAMRNPQVRQNIQPADHLKYVT